MSTNIKRKAFAYITRGNRLLVFEHVDLPEAGIQVPAGTINKGESPDDAVLREAHEETGLSLLTVHRFLGAVQRDMNDYGIDEVHHRYFFHLTCDDQTPETWQHVESQRSDGGPPVRFRFWWVALPDGVPDLIADHDYKLGELDANTAWFRI